LVLAYLRWKKPKKLAGNGIGYGSDGCYLAVGFFRPGFFGFGVNGFGGVAIMRRTISSRRFAASLSLSSSGFFALMERY
jgi:hypothetical protein